MSMNDRTGLGAEQAVHVTGSRTHMINLAIAGTFALLLGGAALALGINALVGEPGRGIGGAALLFGAFSVAPVIGLVFLARKLSWRLTRYDHGFALKRGSEVAARWSDVKSVFVGGLNIDQYIELHVADGSRVKIDNSFQDFADFATAARSEISRSLVAAAAPVIASGRTVSFGKLALGKAGIDQQGKPTISWPSVARIVVEERVDGNVIYPALVIWEKSAAGPEEEWANERISKFPNFDAFVELTGQFCPVQC